jgi:putative transposase
MKAAVDVMPTTGARPILNALGLSAATFYRQRTPKSLAAPAVRAAPARALSEAERTRILNALHSERFVDRAPAQVVATLLDEGIYHCSERTMYRLLEQHGEVKERRNQLRHPEYKKPELVATAPNQVWSWDITKLRTFVKLKYLYLYVILDIFSRYVVGWMLAEHENATLAKQLIAETCLRHDVNPKQLVLHSDRGSPMRSNTLAQLLATLDVTASFSRPHVSDDNPFSESQFKTLKYHSTFPDRFGGLPDGKPFCEKFLTWYNREHHHSGIAYLTPYDVHYGNAAQKLAQRHSVQLAAYQAHPERFIHGPPRLLTLPPAVYINKPEDEIELDTENNSNRIDTNSTDCVSQTA